MHFATVILRLCTYLAIATVRSGTDLTIHSLLLSLFLRRLSPDHPRERDLQLRAVWPAASAAVGAGVTCADRHPLTQAGTTG